MNSENKMEHWWKIIHPGLAVISMKANKNEIVFYFSIGVATLLNEIGIQFGYAICTLLPSMLIVGWLGHRAFPTPSHK
jgi:hypothetical protein